MGHRIWAYVVAMAVAAWQLLPVRSFCVGCRQATRLPRTPLPPHGRTIVYSIYILPLPLQLDSASRAKLNVSVVQPQPGDVGGTGGVRGQMVRGVRMACLSHFDANRPIPLTLSLANCEMLDVALKSRMHFTDALGLQNLVFQIDQSGWEGCAERRTRFRETNGSDRRAFMDSNLWVVASAPFVSHARVSVPGWWRVAR